VDWHAAVKASSAGVTLDVEVVPGARESRFPAGYNAWRKRLEAKVRAPPEDGKANAELCALVADALGVPGARVSVLAGHTSRRKTIAVAGVDVGGARAALAPALGG
jgi:uncharacterized protein (TIGR00251 family)